MKRFNYHVIRCKVYINSMNSKININKMQQVLNFAIIKSDVEWTEPI